MRVYTETRNGNLPGTHLPRDQDPGRSGGFLIEKDNLRPVTTNVVSDHVRHVLSTVPLTKPDETSVPDRLTTPNPKKKERTDKQVIFTS